MCFYEKLEFECGHWKWQNFKQHCTGDYRPGETCGAKFSWDTQSVAAKCRACEKIDRKNRKREREEAGQQRSAASSSQSRQKSYFGSSVLEQKTTNAESDLTGHKMARSIDGQSSPFRHLSDSTGESLRSNAALIENVEGSKSMINDSVGPLQMAVSSRKTLEAVKVATTAVSQRPRTRARKVELPVLKDTVQVYLSVERSEWSLMACADSGSCVNAISLELTQRLGVVFEKHNEETALRLTLPNGSIISSTGHFEAKCAVIRSGGSMTETIDVEMVVFKKLLYPDMLMGEDFLDELNILSHLEDFLLPTSTTNDLPKIRSLGNSPKLIKCNFDGEPVLALADTGAEVDCISRNVARKRYRKLQKTTIVAFANGSRATSTHVVSGRLSIGWDAPDYEPELQPEDNLHIKIQGELGRASESNQQIDDIDTEEILTKNVIDAEFHTLEGLQYDFMLGGRSLQALQAYKNHPEEFICTQEAGEKYTNMCRVSLSWKWRKPRKDCEAQSRSTLDPDVNRINQIQLENARREEAESRIAALTGDARAQAASEEQRLRDAFDALHIASRS